jgi:RimJ/RimL family protein N-acetyltransferase
MSIPQLESERLIYKPISQIHLSQDYVDWLNDEEVNRYLESGGNYTLVMLKDYITGMTSKDILFWGIHIKENGMHIGNIKIDPVNSKHGLGEYGILMGRKSEWNKGYAREASKCIIDYCFNTQKIRKITLGVVEDNTAAVVLYNSLGFETEGIYQRHGLYQGHYCNTLRMALFNPTFNYECK